MNITVSYYNKKYKVDMKSYEIEDGDNVQTHIDLYKDNFFQRTGVKLDHLITSVRSPQVTHAIEKREEISTNNELEEAPVRKKTSKQETKNQ